MTRLLPGLFLALGLSTVAHAQAVRPDQREFRGLYEELVEIDTTLSNGSCTRAAEAMAVRLRAAGYPAADVRVLTPPQDPRWGNLVATLHGTDASAPAILLLAHIDVVEARREDWERDPFTLVEEGGFFYARGASDDKAQAAAFTDSMIRWRREGYRPRRTIKLALTCGEETSDTFDGVSWLLEHHPETLRAGIALNEGASGRVDDQGRPQSLEVQAGEKVYQDFTLAVTNPGGHSSRPVRENAIYRVSAALGRLAAYDFPVRMNDTTRAYFAAMARTATPAMAADLRALSEDRASAEQIARVAAADPGWNSSLRTTCVATTVTAGHAPNALPQRAAANVNCRVFPGQPVLEAQAELERVLADPAITVTRIGELSPTSPAPPLSPEITEPVRRAAARVWPGLPIIPTQATGATDGRFTNAAGIPTYGVTGMLRDPDGNGVHGLNERLRVRSLYDGRDFLHLLVEDLAGGGRVGAAAPAR